MKTRSILFFLLLFPKIILAESINYLLFKDLVQYTSSVDAYSNICVKDFNHKQAESDLFDLFKYNNQCRIGRHVTFKSNC